MKTLSSTAHPRRMTRSAPWSSRPSGGNRMLLDEHRPPRSAAPRALRRRHVALWVAIVLPLTVLGVPVVSYLHALRAPGSTDWQLTTVEWIRDHGGGPL